MRDASARQEFVLGSKLSTLETGAELAELNPPIAQIRSWYTTSFLPSPAKGVFANWFQLFVSGEYLKQEFTKFPELTPLIK